MKKNIQFLAYTAAGVMLLAILSFTRIGKPDNSAINGSWKLQHGTVEQVLLLSDGYFMHTTFDKQNKKLIGSRGGVYNFSGNELAATVEFNISDKDQIGQRINYTFAVNNNKLSSNISGKAEEWTLLDNGRGAMAGTWRMSGRMQDGKISLNPPRARKTLKVLTGSRFQWAAINAETKEFFGTGGGAYTFSNGKYTENIEYFSRDSNRVGASLTFNGKIEDGLWHHSGLSSAGAPIYEIWKMEPK